MSSTDHDAAELAEFGYRQTLDRTLGSWATFAAGFSFISILTGTFTVFYFGAAVGGPAYVWTWPIVFVGQLMVAFVFAELAAEYPVAGSVYNWAKRLASPLSAWLCGWAMLISTVLTIASAALALQIVLPQISPSFQLVGDGTGTYDYSTNAVILAGGLVVLSTVVNLLGVRITSLINQVGVFIELVGCVLLIVLLAVFITRGPSVLFETQGTGDGRDLGYFGAFLVAGIASGYAMYGFDTASSLGEETKNPRRNSPRAVLRAIVAAALIGFLLICLAFMAVSDTNAEGIALSGLPFVVKDVLGTTFGNVMLWIVVIAVTVCVIAVQAAAVRMMFAMARDNALPFGRQIAHVSEQSKVPIVATVVAGAGALVVLIVNVRQPQIITAVVSLVIVFIYISYLFVTVSMLRRRMQGQWPPAGSRGQRYFSLGRRGTAINALAVVWGLVMTVNLMWPRAEVYNAVAPFHWYLKWVAPLAVVVVLGGGALYFHFIQRHRVGVLAEHASVAPVAPVEASIPADRASVTATSDRD